MSGKSREKSAQVIAEATGKVLEVLSALPEGEWERPWSGHGLGRLPWNPATGNGFSGLNLLVLLSETWSRGLCDPRYMTYRQALKMGEAAAGERHDGDLPIHVKKGAKSILVFRPIVVKTMEEAPGEGDDEEGSAARVVGFRGYRVFNAQDIEGLPDLDPYGQRQWEEDPLVEDLVRASGIEVEHGVQERAFYDSGVDRISMPAREAFPDAASYYSTLLHEWYHATGHKEREGRPIFCGEKTKEARAREELGAECFSLMASALLGLPVSIDGHAKYLASWNKMLADDPREIARAMTAGAGLLEAVDAFAQGEDPALKWWPGQDHEQRSAAMVM